MKSSDAAFPQNPEIFTDAQKGMSLRAYLAGQALVGLLAVEPSDCTAEDFARSAVLQADALIAELNKEAK